MGVFHAWEATATAVARAAVTSSTSASSAVRAGALDEASPAGAMHDFAANDDHESRQQLRLLERAIAALPPLDRALMLLYLDERSHREIADVLGIGESNVATKLSRLKQRIREAL